MNFDIKKAFLSPFKTQGWFVKILIYCVLGVISTKFVGNKSYLSIIGIFSLIMITGYQIQFAHNEIHNKIPLLPEWKSNIKKYIKFGVCGAFGLMYCTTISILIAIPIGLLLFCLGDIIAKFFSIILTTLFFFFLLIVLIVYSEKFELKDVVTLNLNKPFKLIWIAKKEFAISTIIGLLLLTLCLVLALLLEMIHLGIILSVFIIELTQLINTNLFAQAYKIAKQRLNYTLIEINPEGI
jgi:hypothetical protein